MATNPAQSGSGQRLPSPEVILVLLTQLQSTVEVGFGKMDTRLERLEAHNSQLDTAQAVTDHRLTDVEDRVKAVEATQRENEGQASVTLNKLTLSLAAAVTGGLGILIANLVHLT